LSADHPVSGGPARGQPDATMLMNRCLNLPQAIR
jgi:hypothetical protein